MFGPNDVKRINNVKNIGTDVLLVGEKKDSLYVMSVVVAYVEKTAKIKVHQHISAKKLLDGVQVIKGVNKCIVCQGC